MAFGHANVIDRSGQAGGPKHQDGPTERASEPAKKPNLKLRLQTKFGIVCHLQPHSGSVELLCKIQLGRTAKGTRLGASEFVQCRTAAAMRQQGCRVPGRLLLLLLLEILSSTSERLYTAKPSKATLVIVASAMRDVPSKEILLLAATATNGEWCHAEPSSRRLKAASRARSHSECRLRKGRSRGVSFDPLGWKCRCCDNFSSGRGMARGNPCEEGVTLIQRPRPSLQFGFLTRPCLSLFGLMAALHPVQPASCLSRLVGLSAHASAVQLSILTPCLPLHLSTISISISALLSIAF